MSLIISISGIRGTIGGPPGEGLTPVDTVQFAAAFAVWLKRRAEKERPSVVLGRDARLSGPMVEQLVSGTLCAMGVDVLQLGLATTPTVEMSVPELSADGGIVLTASHNPLEWNALKLLNDRGEFLSSSDGEALMEIIRKGQLSFSTVKKLGRIKPMGDSGIKHIDRVLGLDLVKRDKIRDRGFRVAIDCVNSVGGIVLPRLLEELGVREVIEIYCEPDGNFPHNPEPLPENLADIARTVKEKKADVGFVVDPDVDRLAIICEDGSLFGEEYTLVAVADYVLSQTPGDTASNLSSTRALKDITEKYGRRYFASAVGEVNVVEVMKEQECVIGGEGNGGVIYPALHYGRDALVGIALFLTHLAESGLTTSALRKTYPDYIQSKNKIEITPGTDTDRLLERFREAYSTHDINTGDGVKVEMPEGWIHVRKSNTEPIIRMYTEGRTKDIADELAAGAGETLRKLMN